MGNPRKPAQPQRKPGGNPHLLALMHPLCPYKAFNSIGRGHAPSCVPSAFWFSRQKHLTSISGTLSLFFWVRLIARDAMTPRHFCVAGVALGDIYRRFTWPVWHLATSNCVLRATSTLRCGRGTYETRPSAFTPSFTHNFVTHHLSHTTLHIQPFNSSIIHHLLCLSCLPRPAGTLCFCLIGRS